MKRGVRLKWNTHHGIARPAYGEVWLVDLDPIRGIEIRGRRPVAIVSADRFNRGGAGLVYVAPMTRTERGNPLHVRVAPPEAGLREPSVIKCDMVRSIDIVRLLDRWGILAEHTMAEVMDRIRLILGL